MSAATHPVGVRRGAAPDPHIVELGKLMLGRAPKLGKAMADLLCREIDAYSDGTVVTKDEVRESCVANVTFIFDSLAGDAAADVLPAEHTGTESRARRRAAAGRDDRLPHRIPIHVGADPRGRARRGHTDRLDPGCHRTGLPRSGHLYPGDEHRLSPTADSADPRAGGRAIGAGGSVAVPTDHRQSEPLGGGRPAAATHLGTVRRRGGRAARDREAGITHDRKQALRP